MTLDGFMKLNEITHKETANRIAEWKGSVGDPGAVFKVGEPEYQEEYGLWKGLEELFCIRKTRKGYDPRDARTITSAEVEAIIRAWNTNDR